MKYITAVIPVNTHTKIKRLSKSTGIRLSVLVDKLLKIGLSHFGKEVEK